MNQTESKTLEQPKGLLSKKTLFWMGIKSMFLQASFNYERMQACGFLFGMLPALTKIYKNDPEKLSESMKVHLEFFNTNPFIPTIMMGLVASMEENRQPLDIVRNIKIATMGPFAGIGDALIWFTALPIAAGVGASLSLSGNYFGPILFLIIFNSVALTVRFGCMFYFYRLGTRTIPLLKKVMPKVNRVSSIIGLIVVGGLIASYIKLKTTLVIPGHVKVNVQTDVLDKIMPDLLPALLMIFIYVIYRKGVKPIWLILIIVLIGLVGKFLHIF